MKVLRGLITEHIDEKYINVIEKNYMSFKFNITEKYREMINLHVSQTVKQEHAYLSVSESEYKLFKDFVGTPKNVLELGCGLGRMSIYLNSQLQDPSIHYILADSTKTTGESKYGWEKVDLFYNDLSLTEKFAKDNNLNNFETFDVRKRDLNTLSNIDFVMSFLAVGFHNKIEHYMDDLLNITTDDCLLVFGVRRGKYAEKDFEQYFKNIQIITSNRRAKEDILIMKEKVLYENTILS